MLIVYFLAFKLLITATFEETSKLGMLTFLFSDVFVSLVIFEFCVAGFTLEFVFTKQNFQISVNVYVFSVKFAHAVWTFIVFLEPGLDAAPAK